MLQATQKTSNGNFALIALGSNMISPWGDVTETVRRAVLEIAKRLDCSEVCSDFYETPAFPAGAGPNFVNAAIRVETDKAPTDILTILHEIEAEAARARTVRWGQRTLDLDLIAVGDQICPDRATYAAWRDLSPEKQAHSAPDQLILPHPRLQDRSFVLIPLADVAPDWVHPVCGLTVVQMRDARPDAERASVVPLDIA